MPLTIPLPVSEGWYSRTELNRDHKFRKLVLYPFELRERKLQEA
jgi:hypothetical protein